MYAQEHVQLAASALGVGIIQGDDYPGYATLFRPGSPRMEAWCWAPVRRTLEAALQAGHKRAGYALTIISALDETEGLAAAREVSVQERTRRRPLGTRSVVDQRSAWARKLPLMLVPGIPLAKAIGTMPEPWQDLLVIVE